MGTVARAIGAYIVLLIVLRVVGRRTGKRMTSTEVLLIFLLGGQMTQSILGDDRSFTNACLGVSTVALMHTAVNYLKQRIHWFAKLVDGTPLIIYERGEWYEDRMDLVRVQRDDVMASAREEGMCRLDDVRYAIVERNGAISIIKDEEKQK